MQKKWDQKIMKSFASGLLQWNDAENKRQMPWKGEQDPYKIWLSEIILQQTRVEQGLGYYQRFVQTFSNVHALAAAPEQQVFKLWEGLGYYSRCKNLIATANYISETLNGVFPTGYESILALKGVGPYTAAAIASFAYNLPYAVLDGNVYRVLARIFALDLLIDSAEGKKTFAALAQQVLPQKKAGAYNQAIMDFGATICKPLPDCARCFFKTSCLAFQQNRQLQLPIKGKAAALKERWFHYIIVEWQGELAIRQRTAKDIWQHLYEVPLFEAPKQETKTTLLTQLEKSYNLNPANYAVISAAATATQKLSHQKIYFSFMHIQLYQKKALEGLTWVAKSDLPNYAFPTTLLLFLTKNDLVTGNKFD
ncbi:MAG TPA: A/G-specific adenine glycosylase [Chitinophagaceae bacterium]|nr:A/G-specific adenine glycosylase [Chitinophagaceae bacterium]